jgi:membrane protein YqaA with SNARE-associated domain
MNTHSPQLPQSPQLKQHTYATAEKWLHRLANTRYADAWLFLASFLETLIVPIPIEIILIPYMLLHTEKIWRIATVVTAGCLTAALVGYGIGFYLFESLGFWVIETFQYQAQFEQFRHLFDEYGFFAILTIGIIPIPFQVAMLTAGVAQYPLILFVLAATIARSIRYFGLGLLVLLIGPRMLRLWQNIDQPRFKGLFLLGLGLLLIAWLFWRG